MICATCKAEGQTSTVIGTGVSTTTAMYYQPFYDERGVYHSHDHNVISIDYRCSRGHRWTETAPLPRCPGCAWPEGTK